ncbi:MAG: lysophospholipid acyltransferase family protein [Chthoniobacter sp.]|nr:lysophospholipid acyltransferase family protein [Chthoniobacter sp.]
MKPATKAKLIALVGGCIVKALCCTLRFRIQDPGGFLKMPHTVKMTGIFWHNTLFIIPWFYSRYMSRRDCPRHSKALTSASKDGEILAAFLARFDIGAIRGSSSRRGAVAMLEMVRTSEAGYDIAITPDGPRGPKYQLNPGVITLAQKAKIPVLGFAIFYSSYWQLKSWDAFRIPKPFATVDITLLPLETIPDTDTPEAFETQRARLEKIMRDANHVAL